ncbi:MAG: hypothetical protein KGL39_11705 [Patescibacteria group bacterium]|nr:hypothetical protein [Patescibacteria group bacterium]
MSNSKWDGRERRQSSGDSDILQRIAVLETNQLNIAKLLNETANDLKQVSLKLAERRGAERLALAGIGMSGTIIGFLLRHAI